MITQKELKELFEYREDRKSNSHTTVSTNSLVVLKDYFRPLTPIECERLQSLPDNYTEGLSKTARKKALGNGFNCAVIKHILENILCLTN
jgi:site-specific DNA-cytosine methylase